jgi:hypothetical protein
MSFKASFGFIRPITNFDKFSRTHEKALTAVKFASKSISSNLTASHKLPWSLEDSNSCATRKTCGAKTRKSRAMEHRTCLLQAQEREAEDPKGVNRNTGRVDGSALGRV